MKRLIILTLGVFLSFTTFAEKRNALLIANGKYKSFGNLATPVKEAKDLKKSLEKLGFTVTIVENGGKEKISDSLYDFQQKLEKSGGIGFFHYGGHAVQVNGKNYIIPVDADIPDERRVASRAVDVDEVMASMQADTNIIILDACRNNPLPASSGRSATRGLVLTEYKPKNSIIIYSAQPGKVAQDGIFTPILTEKLLEKKSLADVLMDVRRTVRSRTNNEQSPGEYSELESMVYLAGFADMNKNDVIQSNTEKGIDYVDLANKAFDEKKYKLAFEYFSKADKITDAYSQGNFACLYATGDGGYHNYAKALEWYTKAANQSDAYSQHQIGFFYQNGYGVKQDFKKAKNWYEKAAKQGYNASMNNLGYIYYAGGNGISKSYTKSKYWYEKAANNGYAMSQHNLALLYYDGLGVDQDTRKAKEWLEKAAAQGYENAISMLKQIDEDITLKKENTFFFPPYKLEFGKTTVEDLKKIGNKDNMSYTIKGNWFGYDADSKYLNWYTIFTKNWLPNWEQIGYSKKLSHNEWISILESLGYSIEKNDFDNYTTRLITAFRESPKPHVIFFNFFIEKFEYNKENTLRCIGISVQKEDLADYFIKVGNKANKQENYTDAFNYFQKAADLGNAYAQSWVGYFYRYGVGTKKNFTKALEYFEKAANQGDAYSCRNLAENYEYGFEVAVEDSEYGYAKNFDKAFYWYKKAAEQGDVEAQTWMGALYSITYRFFGIKQNIPEAKKWFKKAADQGDAFAKQQLKEL